MSECKYRPGPWKTVSGHEVIIFEITDDRIFGKYQVEKDRGWMAFHWTLEGAYYLDRGDSHDLAPIEKPKRKFECWLDNTGEAHWFSEWKPPSITWTRLPSQDFEVKDE